MSKSLVIICAFAGASLSTITANAQQADLSFLRSQHYTTLVPERSMGYVNNLNMKAIRNFRLSYKSVFNESWSESKDCFRVNFMKDSVHYMVDYYKKGNWRSTIRIFGEQDLPKDIRWTVKSTYIDYKIVTVTELQYGKVTAYFIKLEGSKDLKTIRYMNDEMEVVEEYNK